MLYFIIYLILFYVNDSVVLTKKMCSQSENGIPDRTLSSFILKLDRSALHVFCFLIKVVNNIMQSVTGNSTGIHVHCKPG